MSQVVIRNANKKYGDVHAVKDVNLQIRDQEFMVFVGPSGCGKTTTLRMVAGLEAITSGDILIGDRVVNDLPPMDRDIAMVFQNYALYPHMTIFDNIAFGLKRQKVAKAEIQQRVEAVSKTLGLDPYLGRLLHLGVDLGTRPALDLQRETHVVGDVLVRVERIVLEHHRDVAVLRHDVVDDTAADADLAA